MTSAVYCGRKALNQSINIFMAPVVEWLRPVVSSSLNISAAGSSRAVVTFEQHHEKTCFFEYVKTKAQISCASDQCLCFRYIAYSTISFLPKSFNYLTAVTGVGTSPVLATCETSQVLLAGVSGGFPGYSSFAPPTDWLSRYE